MKKRGHEFGRYLKTVPAAPFLVCLDDGARGFVAGFTLAKSTRPYLASNGSVRVRLVFRDRDLDITHVMQFTLRGALTDELMAVLDDAVGPHCSVHAHA